MKPHVKPRRGRVTELALILGVSLVVASCAQDGARPSVLDEGASPQPAVDSLADSHRTGSASCPVTIPSQPGMVPPQPYPAQPPAQYDALWYGTDELWTMLDASGAVWDDLPGLRQKTFWWSDGYSWRDEPQPQIMVTARRLDGVALTVEAGGPGTNGNRADIGSFMLVGIEFPAPGCWELTARYNGAELSYVVSVAE